MTSSPPSSSLSKTSPKIEVYQPPNRNLKLIMFVETHQHLQFVLRFGHYYELRKAKLLATNIGPHPFLIYTIYTWYSTQRQYAFLYPIFLAPKVPRCTTSSIFHRESILFNQPLLKICLPVLQGFDPLLVPHQQLLHRLQAGAPHHLGLVGEPSQQDSSI